MIKKQKKMLFYGDYNCDTGFATVSKKLIEQFAKDKNLSITVFAINDFSTVEDAKSQFENVAVIPALATSKDKKDVYCRLEFLNLIYKVDYDVIFFLNDVEVFNPMYEHLQNVKNRRKKEKKQDFKTIIYFPIDSPPRKEDLKVLEFFNVIVTYTQYAQTVLLPLLPTNLGLKIRIIHHGCDTDVFKPLEDNTPAVDMKQFLFGSKDVFVFGTVNRNSARKDLGTLVLGYSIFKKTNPDFDCVLYLHCNPYDKAGINIQVLCERLGLVFNKDVVTPMNYSENQGYKIEELNLIYNTFDCFITTTTAEGWGLTVAEAMATKKLVVAPKHTSLLEITQQGKNCLSLMFSHPRVFVNDFEKIRMASDPIEVANVMKVVSNFPNDSEEAQKAVEEIKERAYQHVLSYSWEKTANDFKKIIDELFL